MIKLDFEEYTVNFWRQQVFYFEMFLRETARSGVNDVAKYSRGKKLLLRLYLASIEKQCKLSTTLVKTNRN